MKFMKSITAIVATVGCLSVPAAAYAAKSDVVRPQTLVTPQAVNNSSNSSNNNTPGSTNNNGNHGQRSTDNSVNCQKNSPNNAQNSGNCPGPVAQSN
jgi:hypothetical protein